MTEISSINRLQFRHHGNGNYVSGSTSGETYYYSTDGVFNDRDEAINYLSGITNVKYAAKGLGDKDAAQKFSLFAEPTILRYKNTEDENDPHVILAIGSVTNNMDTLLYNHFCVIDIDKTESEIKELGDDLRAAIKGLSIFTKNTDTLDLYYDKTADGTIISGDVRVAESQIFDNTLYENKLLATKDGLFTFVDMRYDSSNDKITFTVNGDVKEYQVNNNSVVAGWYSRKDESLHLKMNHGDDIVISLEYLIDEWAVEGTNSNTPIVLTREKIGYGSGGDSHGHAESWQDILRADIRLASGVTNNILEKTIDGHYLFVRGTADNILCYRDGQEMTVQSAITECANFKVSNDSRNIIGQKNDGIYATVDLSYDSTTNSLNFTVSNPSDNNKSVTKNLPLNTVETFKNIYYDSVTEELVILYVDGTSEVKTVRIAIGQMLKNWEWNIQNEGHNVKLYKARVVNGDDVVSADVDISTDDYNILVDKGHKLYVQGVADNIKYSTEKSDSGTVKSVLDSLSANSIDVNSRLNETSGKVDSTIANLADEVERSKTEDGALANTLKTLSSKTDSEIARATNKETEIETKFDAALGDPTFGTRNTVRDAVTTLSGLISTVSANTEGKIASVSNFDHSINVNTADKTNPILSVNISNEQIGKLPNLIKLNNDGLYVGVDLTYTFNETGKNFLTFTTTNGSKTIDLQTNSMIDKIYYDTTNEELVIEYTVNGERMDDVKIPVSDLVDEWDVSPNTNGAIYLSKTRNADRNKDIISAEVIISEHADNIILNDNGALYVSNSGISTNAQAIASLTAKTTSLDEELTQEITDRESDVQSIISAITAEINNRISADTTLDTKIESEKTRATTQEVQLSDLIAAETNRATKFDDNISAVVATLQNDLTSEVQSRKDGDNTLSNELTAEINDRKAAIIAANTYIDTRVTEEADARTSADNILTQSLNSEVNSRTSADTELATKIETEKTRAQSEEARIEKALGDEIIRATALDNEHTSSINILQSDLITEATNRINSDYTLSGKIESEISNRVAAITEAKEYVDDKFRTEQDARSTMDNTLANSIKDESTRALSAETEITKTLNSEIKTRQENTESLQSQITSVKDTVTANKTTFVDTPTVDFTDTVIDGGHSITADVKIANADENLIVKSSENEGLYATAHIKYDGATNSISLIGTNGTVLSKEVLGAGSIVNKIYYDQNEKDLVVEYYDGNGVQHTSSFPVADLFNEWEVKNPLEKSAIKLTKISQTGETENIDYIQAQILIFDDNDGDGYADSGDNLICIRDNALYVSGGTNIQETRMLAECTASELETLEKVVLGNVIEGECGSGFTYTPKDDSKFISGATSLTDADSIIDDRLYALSGRVENLLNTTETPTVKMSVSGDAIYSDVKLSHGNRSTADTNIQTDSELTIGTTTDSELTDTNVLRIVDTTTMSQGGYPADISYNGLYLSNVWDCGTYNTNGEGTAYSKYKTDESSTAQNYYNQYYSNNLR